MNIIKKFHDFKQKLGNKKKREDTTNKTNQSSYLFKQRNIKQNF